MSHGKLVYWRPDLQEAFKRLADDRGDDAAAELLGTSPRTMYDLSHGLIRGGKGHDRVTRKRKFVSLTYVERLAAALDEPMLESRPARTQSEWMKRPSWSKRVAA